MKKKLLGILALSILFSSCGVKKDTYVSKRHPEDNQTNAQESTDQAEESTDIQYTENNEEETQEPNNDQENNQNNQDNQDGQDKQDGQENNGEENVDGVEYQADNTLNMRLAPSTDSGVVVEVPGGSTVIKIGENGEWTRATYNGYTGYILTELLSPVN